MGQSDRKLAAGTPRWVKVQGFFVGLLILIVVAMSTGLLDTALFGFEGGHKGGH